MSAPRRVIVTGAASGIGRAAALALKARGAEIWGVDRADPGTGVDHWIETDLGDREARLPSLPQGVCALVNAAGLPPRQGTEAAILAVNFYGLRRFTIHALASLRDGASIVNMASKAGARWRENIAQVRALMDLPDDTDTEAFVNANGIDPVRAYDLSKEAVIVWTKSATAAFMARGFRANCVSPAAVDTPILDDFVTAFGPRATRGIELTGRAGTAAEVAEVIAFLASPASGWVRGCNIEADGGLTAQLECEAAGITPVDLP